METDPGDESSRPRSGAGSSDWRSSLREAGRYVGLGTQLALTMLLFVGGGFLLDRHFGLTPLFTILGAVLGMVSMFVYLVRLARETSRRGGRNSRPGAD